MIASLTGWLLKPALPYLAGGLLVVVLGLATAWRVESWRRAGAEESLAETRAELTAAQQALADRAQVISALERQAAAAAATQERIEPIRRTIHAANRTSACVASPAVAAGLDRLRASQPPSARPDAGTKPAELPR
ncbi:MAG: hypothetical protein INF79_15480 [Roseomonas sp.]|nr:hypothetical protein [Roseomonas sp.]MCA3413808.1 hypothetical protein [Roseomonas sp.]